MTLIDAPENPGRRQFFRSLVKSAADGTERKAWSVVEGLSAGSGDVFWSGLQAGEDLFVVGDEGAIFRFREGAWQRMDAPVRTPIHAIWKTPQGGLIAVGWMGAVLTFDGQAWVLERGCIVGKDGKYAGVSENTPLFAIAGDETGTAWAVGDNGTILRLDRGDWVAEVSGTDAHLRAITVLSNGNVVAAGAQGTVLLRDPGGSWQGLDCPIASNFQAVAALSETEIILAGGRYFVDENGFKGELIRWREGTFEKRHSDKAFSRFRALAAYRDGLLSVGDRGQIWHIRTARADRLDSGTRHDLLGILPLASGEAIAVGDFGTVLTAAPDFHRHLASPAALKAADLPVWQDMESGTDRQLWGLWHDRRDNTIFACGEEGTLVRYAGDGWERLPSAGDIGFHCLCDAPDGGLFAAGQLGEIHHFDGSAWRKHFDLHVDVTILSLWSDGNGHIFAAGDEGLLLAWDGETWQRMTSGTKSALYNLWGPDSEHLLAVGDFGLILRWNGKRWDEFHAGTENFLFDVWGDRLDNIFIVGLSGTIGHFDGRRWTLTPARARSDLLAISGGDDGVIAVGAAGTALRFTGKDWIANRTGFDGGLRAVCAETPYGAIAAGDQGTILQRMR